VLRAQARADLAVHDARRATADAVQAIARAHHGPPPPPPPPDTRRA